MKTKLLTMGNLLDSSCLIGGSDVLVFVNRDALALRDLGN